MKIIISAGGTGGHIFPALAVINKIKEKDKKAEFLYIGTHNRMEKDLIPQKNIPYLALETYGLKRNKIFKNIKTFYCLFKAYLKSKKIIREFKPDVIIGLGGYVTLPVIYAGHKLKVKTIIHEQNNVLGKTNQFLAKYADILAISFPNTQGIEKFKSKTVYTGNPSSEEALKVKKFDKTKLGFTKEKKLIIFVMGSLGSYQINQQMKKIIPSLKKQPYEVLFVTGHNYYSEYEKLQSENIKIVPFINDLTALMKSSDLIVSRAGATIISEITALSIPSILIPSVHVTDNHQFKNAQALIKEKAAYLLEEKDFNEKKLISLINKVLADEPKLKELKKALIKFQIKDSAQKIYDLIKK